MEKFWIGVACRNHVMRGLKDGFCQVCHGKGAPLKAMSSGDWIVYYSPNEVFGEKMPCREFTAIGRLSDREPYQFQMTESFVPWRRDVDWISATAAPIQPLIDHLSFISDKRRWGFPFKRGCFSISSADFARIADAMGVDIWQRSISMN